jgi:hypothetical protein
MSDDPGGVRVALAAGASVGAETAGPGDCIRALCAKAVRALRARRLAAQRK